MHQGQIVKAVTASGFSQSQSEMLVERVISLLKQTLASGEDVLISGFGRFCVKSKRGWRGRNPATGDSIMLRARKVVTFKCSGKLREKLNS